jgi:hypothetical protein
LKARTFARHISANCPHGERKVIVFGKRAIATAPMFVCPLNHSIYGTNVRGPAWRCRKKKWRDRHLCFEVEKFTMRTKAGNGIREISPRPYCPGGSEFVITKTSSRRTGKAPKTGRRALKALTYLQSL